MKNQSIKARISPKINLSELEYLLSDSSHNYKKVEDTEVYELVKEITDKVEPSYKDKYDTKWEDLYLPLKKRGRDIVIPFNIVLYNNEFYVNFFNIGGLHITNGDKKGDKIFKQIFREELKFIKNKAISDEFITAREYLAACCEDESASNSSRNKILRGLPREYFIEKKTPYDFQDRED